MLDQALKALKTFDWGADPQLVAAIDQAIVDTHGDVAARAVLEAKLATLLGEGVSRDAADYICRKLRVIGTSAAVPALSKLLVSAETSHMARFALDRIATPEAAAALRKALPVVDDTLKAGLVSSLGTMRDNASVESLAELLSSDDAMVVRAAAKALGAIGTSAAAKALTDSKSCPMVTDGLLACAEGLLTEGKKADAKAVYAKLADASQPEHVRLAAARGRLMCAAATS